MTARCGLLWDDTIMFSRFLETCGLACEQVTPHLLAAPFYRGRFAALIIPMGFANPSYSRLLPALRASSGRIRRFLEGGGRLLVFGPGIDRADSYDWMPFPMTYRHQRQKSALECAGSHWCSTLFSGYDQDSIECDGFFPVHGGEAIVRIEGEAVLIHAVIGKGEIIATTIHEYPSRVFLNEFCQDSRETFL